MSSVCTRAFPRHMRALGTARSGILPSRPAQVDTTKLSHVIAGCSAAGAQYSSHFPATQATVEAHTLPEETSRGARRSLFQIIGTLVFLGLAVLSVCVTCGIAGSSPNLREHLAITSAISGLAAGLLHTLCGPDHLAALTPLTIGRNRFSAALLGSLWGMGHSAGQLVLGLAFVLLKSQFTVFLPLLERWAGTVVGLTVLTIGALGIFESLFKQDDGENEDAETLRSITAGSSEGNGAATAIFGTGVLHGLQPDSLFVIIPALALPSSVAAFAYCVMFVIGTVLAMGGYTLFLGTCSEELCRNRPWLQQNLSVIASCVAILVGISVILSAFGVAVPL